MSGLSVVHLDHCSVLITDVERSRRFYGQLLGLREIAKPRTFDFVVIWYDLGNQHLHLLLKDQPDTLSARHFALRVADIQAARAHFAGAGRGPARDDAHPRRGSLFHSGSGRQSHRDHSVATALRSVGSVKTERSRLHSSNCFLTGGF